MTWSVIKNSVIFISFFTLSYSAGTLFKTRADMIQFELFVDCVQLFDMIITCFTAKRSRDIADSTRQLFRKREDNDKIRAVIAFDAEWEVNLKLLTVEYLRTHFLLDFLACIPNLVTLE